MFFLHVTLRQKLCFIATHLDKNNSLHRNCKLRFTHTIENVDNAQKSEYTKYDTTSNLAFTLGQWIKCVGTFCNFTAHWLKKRQVVNYVNPVHTQFTFFPKSKSKIKLIANNNEWRC